ncbi:MAG: DUF2461 domain-containing protein [Bryobacterales bacterium]|nr:DUF2461 domain-containing protein [Bryobacterales bacterium]
MSHAFSGFPEEGIQFLRQLKKNNSREWFQPRKEQFDTQVWQPMAELVEVLNARLVKFAPSYITEPKKAIFRIYRDTRFAKDKTPYKTNIAASFHKGGAKGDFFGGYYVSITAEEVEVGGGIYMPPSDVLRLLRSYVGENHEELRKILAQPKLKKVMGGLEGEQLTRLPKGFLPDHPAADLVRYKHYILFKTDIPLADTHKPAFAKQIGDRFELMAPFIEYLNAALALKKKDPLRIEPPRR